MVLVRDASLRSDAYLSCFQHPIRPTRTSRSIDRRSTRASSRQPRILLAACDERQTLNVTASSVPRVCGLFYPPAFIVFAHIFISSSFPSASSLLPKYSREKNAKRASPPPLSSPVVIFRGLTDPRSVTFDVYLGVSPDDRRRKRFRTGENAWGGGERGEGAGNAEVGRGGRGGRGRGGGAGRRRERRWILTSVLASRTTYIGRTRERNAGEGAVV